MSQSNQNDRPSPKGRLLFVTEDEVSEDDGRSSEAGTAFRTLNAPKRGPTLTDVEHRGGERPDDVVVIDSGEDEDGGAVESGDLNGQDLMMGEWMGPDCGIRGCGRPFDDLGLGRSQDSTYLRQQGGQSYFRAPTPSQSSPWVQPSAPTAGPPPIRGASAAPNPAPWQPPQGYYPYSLPHSLRTPPPADSDETQIVFDQEGYATLLLDRPEPFPCQETGPCGTPPKLPRRKPSPPTHNPPSKNDHQGNGTRSNRRAAEGDPAGGIGAFDPSAPLASTFSAAHYPSHHDATEWMPPPTRPLPPIPTQGLDRGPLPAPPQPQPPPHPHPQSSRRREYAPVVSIPREEHIYEVGENDMPAPGHRAVPPSGGTMSLPPGVPPTLSVLIDPTPATGKKAAPKKSSNATGRRAKNQSTATQPSPGATEMTLRTTPSLSAVPPVSPHHQRELGFTAGVLTSTEAQFVKQCVHPSYHQQVRQLNQCIPMPPYVIETLAEPIISGRSARCSGLMKPVIRAVLMINYYAKASGRLTRARGMIYTMLDPETVENIRRRLLSIAPNDPTDALPASLRLVGRHSLNQGQFAACCEALESLMSPISEIERAAQKERCTTTFQGKNMLFRPPRFASTAALNLFARNIDAINEANTESQLLLLMHTKDQLTHDEMLDDAVFAASLGHFIYAFERSINDLRGMIYYLFEELLETCYLAYLQSPRTREDFRVICSDITTELSAQRDDWHGMVTVARRLLSFSRRCHDEMLFISPSYMRYLIRNAALDEAGYEGYSIQRSVLSLAVKELFRPPPDETSARSLLRRTLSFTRTEPSDARERRLIPTTFIQTRVHSDMIMQATQLMQAPIAHGASRPASIEASLRQPSQQQASPPQAGPSRTHSNM